LKGGDVQLNTIEKRKTRLIEELKNKEYRDAFVSSNVDVGVAFQVRALRKQRNWTQNKLAEISKKKQKTISDLENPSNSPSISTLKKIAAAFEVGLEVRFVPFGDMVKWDLNLSSKSLEVSSFDEDPYFLIEKEGVKSVSDGEQHTIFTKETVFTGVTTIKTDAYGTSGTGVDDAPIMAVGSFRHQNIPTDDYAEAA